MTEPVRKPNRRPGPVRVDSLNTDVIVMKGVEDFTVRPMRESIRKYLEQRGIIPRRPPEGEKKNGDESKPPEAS